MKTLARVSLAALLAVPSLVACGGDSSGAGSDRAADQGGGAVLNAESTAGEYQRTLTDSVNYGDPVGLGLEPDGNGNLVLTTYRVISAAIDGFNCDNGCLVSDVVKANAFGGDPNTTVMSADPANGSWDAQGDDLTGVNAPSPDTDTAPTSTRAKLGGVGVRTLDKRTPADASAEVSSFKTEKAALNVMLGTCLYDAKANCDAASATFFKMKADGVFPPIPNNGGSASSSSDDVNDTGGACPSNGDVTADQLHYQQCVDHSYQVVGVADQCPIADTYAISDPCSTKVCCSKYN